MKSLFVLGDSISVQYGPYLERMLRGTFAYARKKPADVPGGELGYPVDANGGDSSMVLAYLRARLRDHHPDVLLLNCGLHDLRTDPQSGSKQVSPDAYRRNLQDITQFVRNRDTCTVWVRTTPVDDETHNGRQIAFHRFNRDVVQYNEIADAIFAEAGIPVADLYTFTQNVGGKLYCDHVHFTERVRELQAGYLAGCLWAVQNASVEANGGA
jgi:lysophospholipase L1-like esterase